MTEPAKTVAKKRRQIGKYRLIASLGQGGMAKVYLALMAGPAGFNKLLVIKALRDDMSDPEGEYVGMFLEEARLAAQLNHPNVVQTYEVGEADGRYFIAMEYLEGQSLRTAQRRLGSEQLPLPEALRILSETARGLHYAHELRGFDGERLNCVHRDVSPQNVFLTYDGQVKLLDFGIAKTGDPERETQVGVIKGKADYIAPEQVRGERIDRRADVFSLGAMLWETLAEQRFAGGPKISDVTKIHNRVTGAEPSISEAAPETPAALQAICEQAIALDPDDRYQSAEALAEALDAYLEESGHKPSRASLGALLAPAFEAEREKLRELIDAQVQLVQSQAVSVFPGSTGTLPSLGPQAMQSESRSGVQPASNEADGPPAPSREKNTAHSTLLDLSTFATSRDSDAPSTPPATTGPTSRRWLAWGVAVAAVAIGAYLGAASRQPEPSATNAQPEPTSARSPAGGAAQPDPAPREATVRLRIRAEPDGARVTLDGAELPPLPFDARVDRDGKLHRIVATAHGHRTLRQVVTFDQDQDLTLQLTPRRSAEREEPEADQPPSEPTESPARRADAAPSAPAKAPRKPAKRRQVVAPGENLIGSTPTRAPPAPRIDVEDPYQ